MANTLGFFFNQLQCSCHCAGTCRQRQTFYCVPVNLFFVLLIFVIVFGGMAMTVSVLVCLLFCRERNGGEEQGEE